MQELNTKKDTATNPMIMFLVLNTSGLTLIPTTILGYRSMNGAAQPMDVFIPILLATTVATIAGNTPNSSVATCQYLPANIVLGSCWYHWLCRTGNVGIRTDG